MICALFCFIYVNGKGFEDICKTPVKVLYTTEHFHYVEPVSRIVIEESATIQFRPTDKVAKPDCEKQGKK